jgi:uncharacterized hydrophobic protein (TIGR00271 family)
MSSEQEQPALQRARVSCRFLPRWRVLGDAAREQVAAQFYPGPGDRAGHLRRFAVLMALSTLIATFGLAGDSAAVVIGAMLVAPLMTPLLGLACGVTMGRADRQIESAVTVLAGSAGAIGLAWVAAKTFSQPDFVTARSHELLARTQPGTLDLGIALAAGAAGAYVTVHRQIVAALPGAAIAVALIPPLATVGISLELGRGDLASGALLLYLTNLAGIVLAASATFLATGVFAHSDGARFTKHTRRGLIVAAVSVLALGVVLEIGGRDAINIARDQHAVDAATTVWIGHRPLVVQGTTVDGDRVEIDLAGPSAPASTADLYRQINAHLHRRVRLTVRFTEQRILGSAPARTTP